MMGGCGARAQVHKGSADLLAGIDLAAVEAELELTEASRGRGRPPPQLVAGVLWWGGWLPFLLVGDVVVRWWWWWMCCLHVWWWHE